MSGWCTDIGRFHNGVQVKLWEQKPNEDILREASVRYTWSLNMRGLRYGD